MQECQSLAVAKEELARQTQAMQNSIAELSPSPTSLRREQKLLQEAQAELAAQTVARQKKQTGSSLRENKLLEEAKAELTARARGQRDPSNLREQDQREQLHREMTARVQKAERAAEAAKARLIARSKQHDSEKKELETALALAQKRELAQKAKAASAEDQTAGIGQLLHDLAAELQSSKDLSGKLEVRIACICS